MRLFICPSYQVAHVKALTVDLNVSGLVSRRQHAIVGQTDVAARVIAGDMGYVQVVAAN